MSIAVRPAPGKIVVRFVKEHVGKIVVPNTAIEREKEFGVVEAVGTERTTAFGVVQKPPCKAGEVVVFALQNMGVGVPGTKREYGIYDFDEVIAVDERTETRQRVRESLAA